MTPELGKLYQFTASLWETALVVYGSSPERWIKLANEKPFMFVGYEAGEIRQTGESWYQEHNYLLLTTETMAVWRVTTDMLDDVNFYDWAEVENQ